MTAGPPTEPLSEESDALDRAYQQRDDWKYEAEALRARLRDAEETLREIEDKWHDKDSMNTARAYFERHADPQEPA